MSKNRNRYPANAQATPAAPEAAEATPTIDQKVDEVLAEVVRESEQASAPEDVTPVVDAAPAVETPEDVQVQETVSVEVQQAEEQKHVVIPVADANPESNEGFVINPFTGEEDKPEGPVAEEAAPAPFIEQPVETRSTTAQFLLAELEEYARKMKRGQYITPRDGATNQVKLYRLQQRVFNNVPEEDFEECLAVLLDWYNNNTDGVTSDAAINRFMPEWTGTKQDAEAFIRFNSFLATLAHPGARRPEIKRGVNVEFFLKYGLTGTGRERLLAFLGQ